MINRLLKEGLAQTNKSLLLLGPRQTGKSTLLASLAPDLVINLADQETYSQFIASPGELRARLSPLLKSRKERIVIFLDEVQRIPSLLNTVQVLIDENKDKIRFLLSGSSARKLRRGKANLLPGRIHTYQLGPIVSAEYDYNLPTDEVLSRGSLPGILLEDEGSAQKTLRTYGSTYLKEEIQAEALSKNVEGFARFLRVVASWSGELVDFSKVASLASISRQSATRYFDILTDTLIFSCVDPFSKSSKIRIVQHPKFYAFDVGVLNGLLGNFIASDDRIGKLFETLVLNQLKASAMAKDIDARISFFQTDRGAEVDFVVEHSGEIFCIEVKSTANISKIDDRAMKAFESFVGKPFQKLLFYRGTISKEINGVLALPWQEGLRRIGF